MHLQLCERSVVCRITLSYKVHSLSCIHTWRASTRASTYRERCVDEEEVLSPVPLYMCASATRVCSRLCMPIDICLYASTCAVCARVRARFGVHAWAGSRAAALCNYLGPDLAGGFEECAGRPVPQVRDGGYVGKARGGGYAGRAKGGGCASPSGCRGRRGAAPCP